MTDAINKPAHYNQGSIECIEAMKIVLTPDEFRGYLKGNVFKYLWREKDKNGIEDLRKGKSYYDRLIELIDESEKQKAADQQSLKDHPFGKMKEQPSTTKPPDGWRWLEVGEVIRKGDRYFDGNKWKDRDWAVKETYSLIHQKTIRRNRFEVGEKVVAKDSNEIWEVDSIVNGVYQLRNGSVFFASFPEHLAPYIEETT